MGYFQIGYFSLKSVSLLIYHIVLILTIKKLNHNISATQYNLTENLTNLMAQIQKVKDQFEHIVLVVDPLVVNKTMR